MKKAEMKVAETRGNDGKTVKTMAHKNTALKRHACITTYYGLSELIAYKYLMLYGEALSKAEYNGNARLNELSKIYAYDYMDLDRLYGEITAMGYKLVRNDGKETEGENA